MCALCAVLDQLPHAMFVVSSDSRVLFQNRGAQQLLDSSRALKVRRGRLWVGDRAAASMEGSYSSSQLLRMSMPRQVGPQHAREWLHVVRPKLQRKSDPAVLLVFASSFSREVSTRVLQQFYGLTDAEAAIVALLFGGRRLGDIARHLGISPHTVRTHIKRVFTKCSVRSQVDLVRLVALGPGVS